MEDQCTPQMQLQLLVGVGGMQLAAGPISAAIGDYTCEAAHLHLI